MLHLAGRIIFTVAWAVIAAAGAQGRKREAGTALFDGRGELCGRARALWIEPKSTAG